MKIITWFINLFKKSKIVNYLHKNDFLPEPLNEIDELKYLLLVKEGDIEARNVLVEHNMRLVVYIAKRFETSKASIDDLISIGSMGLIKAITTFDIAKNIKLATYASRCIENEILMFLRKVSKMKVEVSLDEILNVDSEGNELNLADLLSDDNDEYKNIERLEEKKIMYRAINKLSDREKEILSLRFGLFGTETLTQKEVATYLKISQSYISRLEKKIISHLKQEMIDEYQKTKS